MEGTAARLLMLTSMNSVNRLRGANSSRYTAARMPIGMATSAVISIVSSEPTIAARPPASSGYVLSELVSSVQRGTRSTRPISLSASTQAI